MTTVKGSKDNPLLMRARRAVDKARIDLSTSTSVRCHSLQRSPGATTSVQVREANSELVKETVAALQKDGYDVTWHRAEGATGVHRVEITLPEDKRRPGLSPLDAALAAKAEPQNAFLDSARRAIANARVDKSTGVELRRHSLHGRHGAAEAQSANLREVEAAVAALRADGYDVTWHKADGATGIHRVEISW